VALSSLTRRLAAAHYASSQAGSKSWAGTQLGVGQVEQKPTAVAAGTVGQARGRVSTAKTPSTQVKGPSALPQNRSGPACPPLRQPHG
jgi:uncharacterized phage protein gp47/JayE